MEISSLVRSKEALDLIDNGTWVGDFDEAPGVRLKVCGMQSEAVQKMIRQKQTALRLKNRNRPLTEEQMAKVTKETLHEAVLKDWEGFTSDGAAMPYDAALAKQWIMSREGEPFTSLVLQAAQRVDSEAEELAKELTKNSAPA